MWSPSSRTRLPFSSSPLMSAFRRAGRVGLPGAAVLLLAATYLRARGTAATASAESSGRSLGGGRVSRAAASPSVDVAIPVEGAPVVRDTLVLSVTAAGQAAAWQQTTLQAQVAGRVEQLPVRENNAIGADQLLVALDPAEYDLAVAEAAARLRAAEASYRELTVFDERIEDRTVRAERDRVARAKSGLDAADVALRKTELDRKRTRVTAPFAGRVASLRVVPGQWVRPGEELLTIARLDPIKVEVQVLEREVGYLAPGRKASVSFSAFPDHVFAGRVETLNPMVDPSTRTARVTVSIPNPGGRIWPGMYARVSLEADRLPDRILVPRKAVLERDRRSVLFVFEGTERGGRAKWRYVTLGAGNDSLVEVVSRPGTDAVRPGEIVLTDGHYTLIHDALVELEGKRRVPVSSRRRAQVQSR